MTATLPPVSGTASTAPATLPPVSGTASTAPATLLATPVMPRATPVAPRATPAMLSLDELLELVERLAADPALLAKVRFDSSDRVCIPAYADEVSEAWLICWCPGQDTGLHDHDGSAAAVAVLDGIVREERLGADEQSYVAGTRVTLGHHDIHRMRNASSETAVTVHAYSPPLGRMSSYFWNEAGLLQRVSVDEGATLAPVR